jgi:hypothetical protein
MVSRLMTAEAVTSFLIRAAAGVTQIYRFGRHPCYDLGIRRDKGRYSGRRIALRTRRRSCSHVRPRSRLSFPELVLAVAVI